MTLDHRQDQRQRGVARILWITLLGLNLMIVLHVGPALGAERATRRQDGGLRARD